MPSGVFKRTKPAWNKGLTKETDERVLRSAETRADVMNFLYKSEKGKEIKKKISKKLKGKEKSVEHKKSLSESISKLRSDPNSVYYSEEYLNKLRVPCSEEQKEKLRIINKGINKAEKHGLWVGGDAGYWARELKKIHKSCYLCKRVYILELHHKDHIRENNERKNLIIICKTCHDFWHFNDRERDEKGRFKKG